MHKESAKKSKRTKVIIIVIIALTVVVAGGMFVASKVADFKMPSHEQFGPKHEN